MKPTSTKPDGERRERQDWLIVLLILLLGFICVIGAGQRALLFSPNWKLPANMESGIDPNVDFLTKPGEVVEPVDPGILTKPAWVKVFLTPGAKFATGTPPPAGAEAVKDTPTSQAATAAVAFTNTLPALTLTNTIAPTNTFVWLPPPAEATWTPKPKKTKVPPTDTPLPTADLEITMNDGGVVYPPGGNLVYTVVVRNNSAYDVTGATVSDLFGAQVTGASWTCSPSIPTATCTNGSGNPFTDTVNLPAGSFVTYAVTASVSGFSAGPLSNTATVSILPFETDPGDNTYSITTAGPGAAGGQVTIGQGNGNPPFLSLGSGNSITMVLSPAIAHNFVFYERYAHPPVADTQIQLDMIQIQISPDGVTWYTVFDWGDGDPGNNGSIGGSYCPGTEDDNCVIPATDPPLINGTGITIDIDSLGYTGSYPWIQITCPAGDLDGVCDIDAIEP